MHKINYKSHDFIGDPVSGIDDLTEEHPDQNMYNSGSAHLIDLYL